MAGRRLADVSCGSPVFAIIAAPTGTQPVWSIGQTQPPSGDSAVSLGYSSAMPSSLICRWSRASASHAATAVPELAQRALPELHGARQPQRCALRGAGVIGNRGRRAGLRASRAPVTDDSPDEERQDGGRDGHGEKDVEGCNGDHLDLLVGRFLLKNHRHEVENQGQRGVGGP